MKNTAKLLAVCLLGWILSFVLLSVFVEIDLRLLTESPGAGGGVNRAIQMAWRFTWVFNPIIVATVSVIVALLEATSLRHALIVVSVLPFILLHLSARSFALEGFLSGVSYVVIALIIGVLVPRDEPQKNEIAYQSSRDF